MSEDINVVIPVRNRAELIVYALQSVIAQTRPPSRIIVVDDGSTDGTCAAVAGFGDRVTLLKTRDAGPAGARNLGLEAAGSEYVGFLDSDDLWRPTALQDLAEALDETAADIAWGLCETLIMPGGKLPDPKWPVQASRLVLIPAMLFRTSSLRSLGGFDASLLFGEDTEFMMRATVQRLAVKQIEQTVLIHQRHSGNMTNDSRSARQAWFEVARRAMGRRREQTPS